MFHGYNFDRKQPLLPAANRKTYSPNVLSIWSGVTIIICSCAAKAIKA
jgi:hypothetical protein